MDNLEANSLGDLIKDVTHQPQPHTIGGVRGEQKVTLTIRQIAECFMRGMLDGATKYAENHDYFPTEKLEYHHLIDLIFDEQWLENFDPLAVVQNASCHIEKVVGIYPNVPPLERNQNGQS